MAICWFTPRPTSTLSIASLTIGPIHSIWRCRPLNQNGLLSACFATEQPYDPDLVYLGHINKVFFFSVKVGESEINKGGQPRTCRLFLVARTSKSARSAYYVNFLVPFFLFFSSLLISSFNSIGATNGDHFCNKKAWPLGLFFSCINLQIVFLIVINSDFFLLSRARK